MNSEVETRNYVYALAIPIPVGEPVGGSIGFALPGSWLLVRVLVERDE